MKFYDILDDCLMTTWQLPPDIVCLTTWRLLHNCKVDFAQNWRHKRQRDNRQTKIKAIPICVEPKNSTNTLISFCSNFFYRKNSTTTFFLCHTFIIYLVKILPPRLFSCTTFLSIWIKVNGWWQILPQHQITYLKGQESASIEIPPFRPNFIKFSKAVSYISKSYFTTFTFRGTFTK